MPLPAGQLPGLDPPPDQQGLRAVWLRQLIATEPVTGYLTPSGTQQLLQGHDVAQDAVVKPEALFDLDYRTGIGIAPDRLVAAESQIYGRGFLALKKGVCIYLEVVLPEGAPDSGTFDQMGLLALGGEGRHAVIHLVSRFAWPAVRPIGRHKPFALLTTPCVFEACWRPRAFAGHLAAAAVPGWLAFSGWDLARGGPRPTRFAVQAGSVYFLDSLPDHWAGIIAENQEDQLQGWGYCLMGVWNDEQS